MMTSELKGVLRTVAAAMPALVRHFGKDEVLASVERVVERNVQPDGPTRDLVLSAMTGDLDDNGLRLLIEVADDLRDRWL